MLSLSDTPIPPVLQAFTERNVPVAFLVPTETGMRKSIMDAIASVRDYLREQGIHDFDRQSKGQANKVEINAHIVYGDRVEPAKVSLYRPETKNGDPRIWISNLGGHAAPHNLISIIAESGELYVVNCSGPVMASVEVEGSPLWTLVSRIGKRSGPAAAELLDLLVRICKRGYVPTLVPGDTGVGMTLEDLLGLPATSHRTPDFKGIEIKASRRKVSGAPNRITLFGKVPDWSISRLKSSSAILGEFGYMRGGVFRLNCTVSSKAPNSQGLFLNVDDGDGLLRERATIEVGQVEVAAWYLKKLSETLREKHAETFWVKADTRGSGPSEEFRYVAALHTRSPLAHVLPILLDSGVVTVDHVSERTASGSANEKGPLFKINPRDLSLLFPPGALHDLRAVAS